MIITARTSTAALMCWLRRCAGYDRKQHIHSSGVEHDVQRLRSTARHEGDVQCRVTGELTYGNDKDGSMSLHVTSGGYVHSFDTAVGVDQC